MGVVNVFVGYLKEVVGFIFGLVLMILGVSRIQETAKKADMVPPGTAASVDGVAASPPADEVVEVSEEEEDEEEDEHVIKMLPKIPVRTNSFRMSEMPKVQSTTMQNGGRQKGWGAKKRVKP